MDKDMYKLGGGGFRLVFKHRQVQSQTQSIRKTKNVRDFHRDFFYLN